MQLLTAENANRCCISQQILVVSSDVNEICKANRTLRKSPDGINRMKIHVNLLHQTA